MKLHRANKLVMFCSSRDHAQFQQKATAVYKITCPGCFNKYIGTESHSWTHWGTHYNCINFLGMTRSKVRSDSYAVILLRSKLWIVLVSQIKSLIQITITSFKEILVNKLSTSRLAMKPSGQKLETLSANENESCTEKSLNVRDDKIGTKL